MARRIKRRQRPSIWGLCLLLCLWSGLLGWGLAQIDQSIASSPPLVAQNNPSSSITQTTGDVDRVPPALQGGQAIYQQRCGTCHLAIPPQLLPSQTWQALLPEPSHFGVRLPAFDNPDLAAAWNYVSTFSRPMPEDGLTPLPFRIARSRFFTVLHPGLKFSEPITPESCIRCHPGVPQLNFRQLSPELEAEP